MINSPASSSILLTYKGKLLLSSPDLNSSGIPQDSWSLIGGKKVEAESFEQAIRRKIKYATKLELKNIQPLTDAAGSSGKCFYHGELTDNDVNAIERREGERLEFFTLPEAEKLTLTEMTQEILTDYKNQLEELLA